MSILVKNMWMPDDCFDCPMCHQIIFKNSYKSHCYVLDKMCPDDEERLAECPLIDVGDDETIRINLNEPIKVKLTDWGKEIYYHKFDSLNESVGRQVCKPSFPKEDEDGYTEFQLWDFMNMYGQYISMGAPNVIEPLEIVYKENGVDKRGKQDG